MRSGAGYARCGRAWYRAGRFRCPGTDVTTTAETSRRACTWWTSAWEGSTPHFASWACADSTSIRKDIRMRRAGVWLAAVLACATPAWGADVLTAETVTLKNGLRLVLAPDPQAKSVDLAVWYDAGSRYDAPGKTGVAHLFEHLMFRGSSHFGPDEHTRLVRAEGGSSGAFAAPDFVAVYETLPPDALELAFRLEADRMTGLSITREGLDAERRLVADERARRATPIGDALDRTYGMAYPKHPYGVSVFGAPSDLSGLTLKDFRDFYRAHFGPKQAVVTVVGNFKRDDAVGFARKYFEPLSSSGAKSAALPTPKPQTAERRATERGDVGVRILMVAWAVPPRSHADWAPFSVLATLLTRAEDAPLNRALISDQPLCLSVQGDVDSRHDASMFYLAMAVAPAADSLAVEHALFDELSRLSREPVDEADLERAKRQTETSVWFGLQTPRSRAQALGSGTMLTGNPADLQRLLERVRAATPADLQRVVAQLTATRRNVLWLLPAAGAGATGGQP